MAWQEITPLRGRRNLATASVTVAWYVPTGPGAPMLRINIAAAIARSLSWTSPMRARVDHDAEAGLIRITQARGDGPAWSVQWKNGTCTLTLRLDGIAGDKRPSQCVPHKVEAGAVVITLPDWAAPRRKGFDGARVAADAARARFGKAA